MTKDTLVSRELPHDSTRGADRGVAGSAGAMPGGDCRGARTWQAGHSRLGPSGLRPRADIHVAQYGDSAADDGEQKEQAGSLLHVAEAASFGKAQRVASERGE